MYAPATFDRVVDHFSTYAQPYPVPVWFAVSEHSIFKVSQSLYQNAPVDALAPDGRTPLMIALSILRLDIAEMLMGSGALIDQPDAHGAHALDHCTRALGYYLRYGQQTARTLIGVCTKIEAFFSDFCAQPDPACIQRWTQMVQQIHRHAQHEKSFMHVHLA